MLGAIVCAYLGATLRAWWTPLVVLLLTTIWTAIVLIWKVKTWQEAGLHVDYATVLAGSIGPTLMINYIGYGLGRGGRALYLKVRRPAPETSSSPSRA